MKKNIYMLPLAVCTISSSFSAELHPQYGQNGHMINHEKVKNYDILLIPTQNVSKDVKIEPKIIVTHCIGLPLLDVIEGLTLPTPKEEGKTKGLGVSAHYFIPQMSGTEFLAEMKLCGLINSTIDLQYPDVPPVICFTQESQRAWHAGVSKWGNFNEIAGCQSGLNSCSIGIEFHAPAYGGGIQDWFAYTPYTIPQMEIGALLMADIIARWGIDQKNILAHSDISPYIPGIEGSLARIKTDPGALFPWSDLRKKGIGYYPEVAPLSIPFVKMTQHEKETFVRNALDCIGYFIPKDLSLTWNDHDRHVVNAYKMHYMQGNYIICRPESDDFGKIDEDLMKSLNGWL